MSDTPDPFTPENLESTQRMLEGLKRRDPAAWKEFADRYLPYLLKIASGKLSDGARRLQDTSDVVQNVIREFFERADRIEYTHTDGLRSYLCEMLSGNLAQAEYQNRRRIEDSNVKGVEQVPAPGLTATQKLAMEEEAQLLTKAIDGFTDEEKRVVRLKSIGLKPGAIVKELGRPPGDTAQKFIRRTMDKYNAAYDRLTKEEGKKKPGGLS